MITRRDSHAIRGSSNSKTHKSRRLTMKKRTAAESGNWPISSAMQPEAHVEQLASELAELRKQLAESLEQQTATTEVRRVISSSPGTLQPVFDSVLAKATDLSEASYGTLWLREGDNFRSAAVQNLPPALAEPRGRALERGGSSHPPPGARGGGGARACRPVRAEHGRGACHGAQANRSCGRHV